MSDGDYSVGDVLGNPKVLVDTVAPTVVFVTVAATVGLGAAATAALGLCAAVFAYRVARRDRLLYAASGLGGVAVGVAFALWAGQAEGFFVPGIVGNLVFAVVCAGSVLAKRPVIAYTSAALYRWPLGWYLHDRVRPAYSEITWVWALFYCAKGLVQIVLVQREALAALTAVRLVSGWPAFAALIAVTYAYVTWRLRRLGGPTVAEWQAPAG